MDRTFPPIPSAKLCQLPRNLPALPHSPKSSSHEYVGSGRGNALAYIRRSSEDRTGKPIAAQAETICSYVRQILRFKEAECEDVREFFIDNGYPGTAPPSERPALKRLLELAGKLGNAQIIAFDISRLARSPEVGGEIKSLIEHKGGKLHLAQQQIAVEGPSLDVMFGIGLQMASSERTNTMQRIRASFVYNTNWDPRKSFGWEMGEDGKPVEIPEEQDVLEKMRKMYEEEGLRTSEIAKRLQKETGGRRWRGERKRLDTCNKEKAPWDSAEVSFLAKKHKWKWGGVDGKTNKTAADLQRETNEAVLSKKTPEEFINENRGTLYDGVKINKAMLKRFFIELNPEWYQQALKSATTWVAAEKYSIDDGVYMLNKNVERGDKKPWTRQTVWRLFKHARERLVQERANRTRRELDMRARENV